MRVCDGVIDMMEFEMFCWIMEVWVNICEVVICGVDGIVEDVCVWCKVEEFVIVVLDIGFMERCKC